MNSPVQDPVARDFARAVRDKMGVAVHRIILFGSRARGTDWEGSDYDMAVVVANREGSIEERVLDAVVEVLDRYDALVSAHVFSDAEWEAEQRMPLGLNIAREGIPI